jgi:hypothetical protein
VNVADIRESSFGVASCPKRLQLLRHQAGVEVLAFVTVDARGPGPPTIPMALMYSLQCPGLPAPRSMGVLPVALIKILALLPRSGTIFTLLEWTIRSSGVTLLVRGPAWGWSFGAGWDDAVRYFGSQ